MMSVLSTKLDYGKAYWIKDISKKALLTFRLIVVEWVQYGAFRYIRHTASFR
jgi:hypothetical protein